MFTQYNKLAQTEHKSINTTFSDFWKSAPDVHDGHFVADYLFCVIMHADFSKNIAHTAKLESRN